MLNKIFNSKCQLYFKTLKKFTSTNLAENDKRFKEMINNLKPIIEKLNSQNEEKTLKELQTKLTPQQKTNVELLVDKYTSLNNFQLTYYQDLLKEKLIKEKKLTALEVNTDWEKIVKISDKIENVNNTYFKQQEFMSNFVSWLSKQPKADLGLGLNVAQAAPTEKKEEKKEEVKEEKKEKAAYDVELTSFDAAKKIALIKEVRGYTNLGLKEAKELVEKAPTVIMKGVKKGDTEAIIKKIGEAGGKVTLI